MTNFLISDKNYSKQLKKGLLIFLVIMIFVVLLKGIGIVYKPSHIVNMVLWSFLFPLFFALFFYFIYVKENSLISLKNLRKYCSEKFASKITTKSIGIIFLITCPLLSLFSINMFLGLCSNYFAKEKFANTVTVTKVMCTYSYYYRSGSSLELLVSDKEKKQYNLAFPYTICADNPHISRLTGETIKLVGRHWFLGKVYDGFYYARDVNIG